MSGKKLTLSEMAAYLHRCEKTFSKYVRLYNIPHIKLGRDMLFDAAEVEAYLRTYTIQKEPAVKQLKTKGVKSPYNKDSERYAKLLGLT